MATIRITAGKISVRAELNDSPTAQALRQLLPVQGTARRWGQEIYFPIPLDQPLERGAGDHVHVGELGYWPPGKAFCIFFGPTPMSSGPEPVAASPVNILGKVLGDATVLQGVRDGQPVRIEAVES